jgi:formylglycine-generating enzyme required for sulfatase activity
VRGAKSLMRHKKLMGNKLGTLCGIALCVWSVCGAGVAAQPAPMPPQENSAQIEAAADVKATSATESGLAGFDRATLVKRIAPEIRPLPPGITSFKDCDVCPEMVVIPIPAGFYDAASSQKSKQKKKPAMPDAKSAPRTLAVGRYEITWGQYVVAQQEAGCLPPRTFSDPVVVRNEIMTHIAYDSFSLSSIECYLKWLTQKTGKTYRLPTSKEWEFAARAGIKTDYPWGDELGQNNAFVGWHYDLKKYQIPFDPHDDYYGVLRGVFYVGRFAPNSWGLYDVIGNANEPTSDMELMVNIFNYDPNKKSSLSDAPRVNVYFQQCAESNIAPCQFREIRGWGRASLSTKKYTLTVYYNPNNPKSAAGLNDHLGLRVVRDMEKK